MVGEDPTGQAEFVSILTRPEGRVQPDMFLSENKLPEDVSILTRPEGRVQLEIGGLEMHNVVVSILTRPEGRVQLLFGRFPRELYAAFQSSPVPKDGCNFRVCTRFLRA